MNELSVGRWTAFWLQKEGNAPKEYEDAYAADDMFKILMGDVVSARKEFIEQHALEVTDLDV